EDTITCTFIIGQIDDDGRAAGKALYTNQRNELVLEADLKGILPDPAARQVLQMMAAEGDPTNSRHGLD
ncbi:MAG: hypothetical protein WCD88_16130, partial [Desulfobacterales bacterium]